MHLEKAQMHALTRPYTHARSHAARVEHRPHRTARALPATKQDHQEGKLRDWNKELQETGYGKLQQISIGVTPFDPQQHSASSNLHLGKKFVDKILEVEQVGVVDLSSENIVRIAQIKIGV